MPCSESGSLGSGGSGGEKTWLDATKDAGKNPADQKPFLPKEGEGLCGEGCDDREEKNEEHGDVKAKERRSCFPSLLQNRD